MRAHNIQKSQFSYWKKQSFYIVIDFLLILILKLYVLLLLKNIIN